MRQFCTRFQLMLKLKIDLKDLHEANRQKIRLYISQQRILAKERGNYANLVSREVTSDKTPITNH